MKEDYYKAYRKGKRAYQKAIVEGRYPFLPALDYILQDSGRLPEFPVGIKDIPLALIAGTKTAGRQESFANNYMPILEEESEFALKWQSLFDSQVREGIRDPVKVYEYLWKFYVLEGNKRVSVLKYLDVPSITADITRILPENKEIPEVQIYYEFLDFYNVAPMYEFRFTQTGSYQKLAEKLGRDLEEPWPEDLLLNLRSAMNAFEKAFAAKGGENLKITVADAFLMYLGIYDFESLLSDTQKEVDRKTGQMWDEFLVESRDDNIAFVENPELHKKEPLLQVLPSLFRKPAYSKERPMRIAFIYDRNPKDSGWIYGHELGRNYLEDCFDGLVETIAFEDCDTEEKFSHAVDTAVLDQEDMVITTSSAQMDLTLKAAVQNPDIKFLNCSVNLSHNAVRTYYGRMYEAKYIMGALAAAFSENHRVGYVADYPIYGSVANINAFAIGAAMIDPQVRIHLTWTSLKDGNWRDIMSDAGIRVFSGPDLIRPAEASRIYGIYRFLPDDTIENLAMPVWDWGRFYELIVQTILNDTWPEKNAAPSDQALNYWWGMSSGVIDVILSKHLSYYSERMVSSLKKALVAEFIHPFAGELHSQQGIVREKDAPGRLSNEEIVAMNWLNDNVVGSLPKLEELSEAGIKAVRTSGVIEE